MKYEAILVLGCGVTEDGTLHIDAKHSIDTALQAMREYDVPRLIMSGYVSMHTTMQPAVGEAQAMKDYAISQGVELAKILTEGESRDTFGNAYFTKTNILLPLNIKHILVICAPIHSEERLRYIFDKVLGTDITYELRKHPDGDFQMNDHEANALKLTHEIFDDVAAGDDEASYAAMRAKHPAYRINR